MKLNKREINDLPVITVDIEEEEKEMMPFMAWTDEDNTIYGIYTLEGDINGNLPVMIKELEDNKLEFNMVNPEHENNEELINEMYYQMKEEINKILSEDLQSILSEIEETEDDEDTEEEVEEVAEVLETEEDENVH
jgi:hypothetical protein